MNPLHADREPWASAASDLKLLYSAGPARATTGTLASEQGGAEGESSMSGSEGGRKPTVGPRVMASGGI